MYYHGSKTPNIKILHPNMSLHKEMYVYLTENIAVALIYTVNAIEVFFDQKNIKKPEVFQPWYSYGFDQFQIPVIEEYYPNATIETYSGKSGYIYLCEKPKSISNPTKIPTVFVTQEPVKTIEEIFIKDVYQEMLKYEKQGLLKINRFENNSDKFNEHILGMIKEDIHKYDLLKNVNHPYGVFLRAKFPVLFKS